MIHRYYGWIEIDAKWDVYIMKANDPDFPNPLEHRSSTMPKLPEQDLPPSCLLHGKLAQPKRSCHTTGCQEGARVARS